MNIFEKMSLIRKKNLHLASYITPDIDEVIESAQVKPAQLKRLPTTLKNRLNAYLKVINDINESVLDCSDAKNAIDDIDSIEKAYTAREKLLDFTQVVQANLNIAALYDELIVKANELTSLDNSTERTKLVADFKKLVDTYSHEELFSLAVSLNHGDESLLVGNLYDFFSKEVSFKLNGFLRQAELDSVLDNLGFSNQKPTEVLSSSRRLIITTKDVLNGLRLIDDYMRSHHLDIEQIHNGSLCARDFITSSEGATGTDSSFEIAWGLLGSLIKHKLDFPYVTTSFTVAEMVIPYLQQHATLIIDGHGGKLNATFADYDALYAANMSKIFSPLIKADKLCNIDHVILQSCTSGKLSSLNGGYSKLHVNANKVRGIINLAEQTNANDLFEKEKGYTSIAESFYQVISTLDEKSQVAFTFSENAINPTNKSSSGNVGAAYVLDGESRAPWYDLKATSNEEHERNTMKSWTLVPSNKHRKFCTENKKTLGLVKISKSPGALSRDELKALFKGLPGYAFFENKIFYISQYFFVKELVVEPAFQIILVSLFSKFLLDVYNIAEKEKLEIILAVTGHTAGSQYKCLSPIITRPPLAVFTDLADREVLSNDTFVGVSSPKQDKKEDRDEQKTSPNTVVGIF